MGSQNTVEGQVRRRLETFLQKSDICGVEIRPSSNLIKDVGLTSLQGLEFVLELCDEFGFEFPAEFNPFVDDEKHKGQTLEGLVKEVERHLAHEGVSNGKK